MGFGTSHDLGQHSGLGRLFDGLMHFPRLSEGGRHSAMLESGWAQDPRHGRSTGGLGEVGHLVSGVVGMVEGLAGGVVGTALRAVSPVIDTPIREMTNVSPVRGLAEVVQSRPISRVIDSIFDSVNLTTKGVQGHSAGHRYSANSRYMSGFNVREIGVGPNGGTTMDDRVSLEQEIFKVAERADTPEKRQKLVDQILELPSGRIDQKSIFESIAKIWEQMPVRI